MPNTIQLEISIPGPLEQEMTALRELKLTKQKNWKFRGYKNIDLIILVLLLLVKTCNLRHKFRKTYWHAHGHDDQTCNSFHPAVLWTWTKYNLFSQELKSFFHTYRIDLMEQWSSIYISKNLKIYKIKPKAIFLQNRHAKPIHKDHTFQFYFNHSGQNLTDFPTSGAYKNDIIYHDSSF